MIPMMNYRLNEFGRKIVQILLCIVIIVITFVITMKELGFDNSDFSIHMNCAINIRREFKKLFTSPADFPFQLAYPMWHILVNIFYKIGRLIFGSGARPEYAAALVTGCVNGCTYLILIKILSFYACNLSEWIAFGLCFVMPIYIPGLKDDFSYFAQGSPVIWHNPTNMIAKPFALTGFFLIIMLLKKIKKGGNISRKECLVLSAVIFLSVLAKPSFFQGIVPALGIYIMIQIFLTKFEKNGNISLFVPVLFPVFWLFWDSFCFLSISGKAAEALESVGWKSRKSIIRIRCLNYSWFLLSQSHIFFVM